MTNRTAYTVEKRGKLWYVLDEDGYDRTMGYEFKYEALDAARIAAADDREEAERIKRSTDRVDGYDRDDLGESPDY